MFVYEKIKLPLINRFDNSVLYLGCLINYLYYICACAQVHNYGRALFI